MLISRGTMLSACVLVFATGCLDAASGAPARPHGDLRQTGEVLLEESDTAYIGRAISIAAAPSGDLFIVDGFSRSILRYSSNGQLNAVLGRRGRGPSEFEMPAQLEVPNDSTMLVSDVARGGVIQWDLHTGHERRILPLEGRSPMLQSSRGEVLIGSLHPVRRTVFANLRAAPDSTEYFGAIPVAFLASPSNRTFFSVFFTAWDDTLAYVVGLSETVRIVTRSGVQIDTVQIPLNGRRGIPSGAVSASMTVPDVLKRASALWAVERMADGRLVVVFIDGTLRGTVMTGQLRLTVLSPDRKRGCIDIPLGGADAEPARLAIVRNSLWSLEQEVKGQRVRSVVRHYELPDGNCEEIPD